MYNDILLAVDLEDEHSWHKAAPVAAEYAQAFGATLHVVTVVPEFGMVRQFFPNDYEETLKHQVMDQLHRFTRDHLPADVPVQHIIAHGTIYDEIERAAEQVNADLIIMASHRPKLKDYLLGPNASRVVRHSERSVLVVR